MNIGKSSCRYEKLKTSPYRLSRRLDVAKHKDLSKLEERSGSKLVWDQSMIIDMDEGGGLVVYISQTEQHCV